jgi:uncharacterized protein (TIGR00725 family)
LIEATFVRGRKYHIGVLGMGGDISAPLAEMAKEIGREIGRREAVLVCGGLGGVFRCALEGVKEERGEGLAILQDPDIPKEAEAWDVVVATGMGPSRHPVIAKTCDGAILIGGGIRSLSLVTYFVGEGKPVVALKGSGGVADDCAKRLLPSSLCPEVESVSDPKAAVELLFRLIKPPG